MTVAEASQLYDAYLAWRRAQGLMPTREETRRFARWRRLVVWRSGWVVGGEKPG